jgi:hypothetical protein
LIINYAHSLTGLQGSILLVLIQYISSLLPVLLKKYQFKARDQALCKLFFIIFALQFDKGGIEFAYPSLSLVVDHIIIKVPQRQRN